MQIPNRELDSVQLSHGFKKRKRPIISAKFTLCNHRPDPDVPVTPTRSGKHLTKCIICKGAYVVEEAEAKARRERLEAKKGSGATLDDCLHDIRVEQRKKAFWRKRYANGYRSRPYNGR